MKAELEIVAFVLFFFAGWLLSSFLKIGGMPHWFIDVVNPVATLLAAYGGAHFAFSYQTKQKMIDEKIANLASVNIALSNMLLRFNCLLQIKMNAIDPYVGKVAREFLIPPVGKHEEDAFTIETKNLNILMSPENVHLMIDVEINSEKYKKVIQLLNERSRLHSEVVQKKMETAGFVDGQNVRPQDFKNTVGERDAKIMKNYTDALVDQINDAIESTEILKDKVRLAVGQIYPDAFLVDFARPK